MKLKFDPESYVGKNIFLSNADCYCVHCDDAILESGGEREKLNGLYLVDRYDPCTDQACIEKEYEPFYVLDVEASKHGCVAVYDFGIVYDLLNKSISDLREIIV